MSTLAQPSTVATYLFFVQQLNRKSCLAEAEKYNLRKEVAERREGDAALDQKALCGVSGDYNADRAVRPAPVPTHALGDFAVQRTAFLGAMARDPLSPAVPRVRAICGATRSTMSRPISLMIMKNLQCKQNDFLNALAADDELRGSGDASDAAGPARST